MTILGMTGKVGILAYGSLIGDPGDELRAATGNILMSGVMTSFNVEFARSSISWAGGPTLVPVEEGGAHIAARVLVLTEHVSEQEARTMLWRRETCRTAGASEEAPQAGLTW